MVHKSTYPTRRASRARRRSRSTRRTHTFCSQARTTSCSSRACIAHATAVAIGARSAVRRSQTAHSAATAIPRSLSAETEASTTHSLPICRARKGTSGRICSSPHVRALALSGEVTPSRIPAGRTSCGTTSLRSRSTTRPRRNTGDASTWSGHAS